MRRFDWKPYIKNLKNVSLKEQWEKDFVTILEKIRVNQKKRVLEVGCSNGRWLRWFYDKYKCETNGIDLEDIGFERGGPINFVKGDAHKLPYKDCAFDLVFSIGLLEHFKKTGRRKILEEKARVLCENGLLILIVPNLCYNLEFFRVKLLYDFLQGYQHYVVARSELEQILEKLQLKVIYFDYIGIFRKIQFFIKIKKILLFKMFFSDSFIYICKKVKQSHKI